MSSLTDIESAVIDGRIFTQWSSHPHRVIVEATEDFLSKASHVLALLRDEVPSCCRHHVRAFLWDGDTRRDPLGPAGGGRS